MPHRKPLSPCNIIGRLTVDRKRETIKIQTDVHLAGNIGEKCGRGELVGKSLNSCCSAHTPTTIYLERLMHLSEWGSPAYGQMPCRGRELFAADDHHRAETLSMSYNWGGIHMQHGPHDPTRLLIKTLKAAIEALEYMPESTEILSLCYTIAKTATDLSHNTQNSLPQQLFSYSIEVLSLFQTGQIDDVEQMVNHILLLLHEFDQNLLYEGSSTKLFEALIQFKDWMSPYINQAANEFNHHFQNLGERQLSKEGSLHAQYFVLQLTATEVKMNIENVVHNLKQLGQVLDYHPDDDKSMTLLFSGSAFRRDIEQCLPGIHVKTYQMFRPTFAPM